MTRFTLRGLVAGAALAALALFPAAGALAQGFGPPPLTAVPDKDTGIYNVGDTVHWKITWTGNSAPPVVTYTVRSDSLTKVDSGTVTFTDNTADVDNTFTTPETLQIELDWPTGGPFPGQLFAGAVAAPGQLKPAVPAPADFDSFWASKVKLIKKIKPNAVLTSEDSEADGVSYWKVTLDNINSTHVQGEISRPTTGQKFPALLQVQYAGVYGLSKASVTNFSKNGWLAMDVEAHDIPIDEPASWYTQEYGNDGPLHNYWNIGNDNRDTSYYLQMYLGAYQALEYLEHRSDWDHKTLVVEGQSQGGQQTLMLCGLHPKGITAGMALVPAACDMMGPFIGQAAGFPNWYNNANGKDPDKVHLASEYYDPIYFAAHIKCPMLIGIGLRDNVLAPPSSSLPAVNAITSPVELILMPGAGHIPVGNSQAPFYNRMYGAWLAALVQGKPAPVNH